MPAFSNPFSKPKPAPGTSPVGGGEAKPSYLEAPKSPISPRAELPGDFGAAGQKGAAAPSKQPMPSQPQAYDASSGMPHMPQFTRPMMPQAQPQGQEIGDAAGGKPVGVKQPWNNGIGDAQQGNPSTSDEPWNGGVGDAQKGGDNLLPAGQRMPIGGANSQQSLPAFSIPKTQKQPSIGPLAPKSKVAGGYGEGDKSSGGFQTSGEIGDAQRGVFDGAGGPHAEGDVAGGVAPGSNTLGGIISRRFGGSTPAVPTVASGHNTLGGVISKKLPSMLGSGGVKPKDPGEPWNGGIGDAQQGGGGGDGGVVQKKDDSVLRNFGEYIDKLLKNPSTYDEEGAKKAFESQKGQLGDIRDQEMSAADADAASRGIFFGGSGNVVDRDKAREKYTRGVSDFSTSQMQDRARTMQGDRQSALDSAFKFLGSAQDEDQFQAMLAQMMGQFGFSGGPQSGGFQLPDGSMGGGNSQLFQLLGSLFSHRSK